jgi:hypothetical protein
LRYGIRNEEAEPIATDNSGQSPSCLSSDVRQTMSALQRLQAWYLSQCNDDWEHGYGVKIDTLDNPGWSLTVDLDGTSLEERKFSEIAYGIGKEAVAGSGEWLHCRLEEKKFKAYGGPRKLEEMLEIFLRWAEEPNQSLEPTAPSGRGSP